MSNGRTSKNEHEFRVNKVAKLLSVGSVRSEISQFASTEWLLIHGYSVGLKDCLITPILKIPTVNN